MTRIVGPTGSRRRRRFLSVPILCIAALALFWVAGAQAVHDDGLFELGPTSTACSTSPPGSGCTANTATNIVADSSVPGPDWADLFNASGNKIPGALSSFGGLADAFIADPSAAGGATDPTTFSGFGTSNKNTDPISTADCSAPGNSYPSCTPWGWAAGNEPSKDDLTNVYAYETVASTADANGGAMKAGDLVLYAGAEREDPSGDSHIDFEFFQNQVGLCQTSGCSSFTGARKPGDVILSMDFLKGGTLGSVTLRRWSGSDYVLEGTASGVGCSVNDTLCAFNNEVPIDGGPWPNFDNHGNVITTLPTNAFTEIGVDLTSLIGANPCLSTFMAKTRSSGSFTAELKDFAGPTSFAPCVPHTTLTKTASPTSVESGGSVTYTYKETNDGSDPIHLTSETDDHCTPVSPTLGSETVHNLGDTNTNGILDPGETWTFTCTTTLTSTTTNTATFVGTDTLSGLSVTEKATATVTVIHPGTSLVKSVSATVTATYTYKETNTGDTDLSSVSVSDDKCSSPTFVSGDTNNDGKLNPGETWTFTCTSTLGPIDTTGGATSLSVQNTGTGHGTDSLGNPAPSTNESDKTTVNASVSQSVTH
jgi:hypothetical protein